jgi:murein DD-endopeptidase MepM/ murein hydrolase activator NlpD
MGVGGIGERSRPLVTPLAQMKLRTAELASALGASYGKVRNWSEPQQAHTKFHQGWDLEAPVGTACRAIADGIIEHVGFHPQFGNQVLLRFSRSGNQLESIPGDTFFAQYAHLSAVLVTVGQAVKAGDTIALTGTSGNASATAPHLHFEIRTTANPNPGLGATGRVDPATILGYQYLRSGG